MVSSDVPISLTPAFKQLTILQPSTSLSSDLASAIKPALSLVGVVFSGYSLYVITISSLATIPYVAVITAIACLTIGWFLPANYYQTNHLRAPMHVPLIGMENWYTYFGFAPRTYNNCAIISVMQLLLNVSVTTTAILPQPIIDFFATVRVFSKRSEIVPAKEVQKLREELVPLLTSVDGISNNGRQIDGGEFLRSCLTNYFGQNPSPILSFDDPQRPMDIIQKLSCHPQAFVNEDLFIEISRVSLVNGVAYKTNQPINFPTGSLCQG